MTINTCKFQLEKAKERGDSKAVEFWEKRFREKGGVIEAEEPKKRGR